MYQPKNSMSGQLSFADFNQSCGLQLDSNNEWVRKADEIPWSRMEGEYAALFPSKTGRPAIPFRMALGALIIQKRKQLSDRALVREIGENPYLQYFIGLNSFAKSAPFRPTVLVSLRKRLDVDFLMATNDAFLECGGATREHEDGSESEAAAAANAETEKPDDNRGTAILDATCSPSNIKYPQDFVLLNDAREALEAMIDFFHGKYHPWKKPRTYRRVARQDYLAMAKSKKRPAKKLRRLIRKQLECIRRDLGYIEEYMAAGYAPCRKHVDAYLTILALYEQQRYMYDNRTHSVPGRIVSISQPYIRPIVRGKAKAPVEFGPKYDVSIDEKGHARLEKVSFDPYNESTVFVSVMERYRARTGHYPKRVLVDRIYRTRKNLAFCRKHGIAVSGPRLGRPPKGNAGRMEKQDNVDRIEVERFFSKEKRCCGAGIIMTRLADTTLGAVALSVLVANIFSVNMGYFFVLFFGYASERLTDSQFIIICDDDGHERVSA